MTAQPRQLNGSLDSLRAAVGEEIRKENHESGLFADYLHDSRMGMSQRIHAETGYEIEIAFTIQIVKKNAFAALEDQRVPVVGLKQKLTFAFDDFVRVWHTGKTIVPNTGVTAERGLARR